MSRLIAIATLAVGVVVLGVFETGAAAQTKSKKGGAAAATTVTGCVQKNSEGHYMLTNVGGGGSSAQAASAPKISVPAANRNLGGFIDPPCVKVRSV